ncbi:MAG: HAMP domain-containing histidine kinase [Oligoflexia bacterium]|nr:HAMP domain-containing histidine kinase [Oligoflexia bacterium]MBF0365317.1 HAMP domain-containing histidine kinase [Oligoflexia bacterium]
MPKAGVENEVLNYELSEILHDFNFVFEELEFLIQESDEATILSQITSGLKNFLGAKNVLYFVYDSTKNEFRWAAGSEECNQKKIPGKNFCNSEGSMLFAIKEMGTSLVIQNTENETRFVCDEILSLSGPQSIVLKRIEKDNELKGVVIFYFSLINGNQLRALYHKISRFLAVWNDLFLMKLELLAERKRRKILEEKLLCGTRIASLNTLLHGIAHEICNPLQIASGFFELLKPAIKEHVPDADSEIDKTCAKVETSLSRIKTIIDFMIKLHPKEKLNTSVDLNGLLAELSELHRNHFQNNGIDLIFTPCCSPVWVLGGETLFEQVYHQLLTNAFDALTDTLCVQMQKSVQVDLHIESAKCIQWCIYDNGIGIEKHNLPKIFDPFFTTKDPGKGPGLGLTLVHNSIYVLNGQISVESERNRFTKICITIPLFNP